MDADAALAEDIELNCIKSSKEQRMVIIAFCDFALWNFDSENFGPVFPKFSFLGQNEAFSATEQNPDFICRQRTENQKLYIEENVMSEQVKMPVRHFLRRDYLHIFFYIKFLVFVSLVHQIRI